VHALYGAIALAGLALFVSSLAMAAREFAIDRRERRNSR
jgi:hypothetical protein